MWPLLPIDESLPALQIALRTHGAAVVQAPPGAGKSTRVPLALLDEPWCAGGTILMLEPRRVAARAVARQMARIRSEPVGSTVGYRVRHESVVSARTRIAVVTEGIVTRMLQRDPTLDGVACVILDEFHERSLHADLALALTLHTRRLIRPELRVVVMSATLDGVAVAALLGDAPVVTSAGRTYPVDVRYLGRRTGTRVEDATAAAVRRAVAEEDGSVLVFLPGAGEIRRTAERLVGTLPPDARLTPLYGDLPAAAQDAAIAAAVPGERKVVLATAIAETSLTIEGVRVVVDCGLARVPRFSPRTGLTRLETVRVSRAGAEQRCGRAGRTEPGVCYRLWDEHEQHALVPFATPEIVQGDLAALALELAAAGVRDAAELAWLDPPPAAAIARARELLRELDAVDADGTITPHGRAMAELPVHPRLAHMLLTARAQGRAALAVTIAALLGERDVLRRGPGPVDAGAELTLRLDALGSPAVVRASGDPAAVRRVRDERAALSRQLGESSGVRHGGVAGSAGGATADAASPGALVALAYPDRVARRRAAGTGHYLLRSGRGAALADGDPLARAEWLAIAALDDAGGDARILLAAPLAADEVERLFAAQMGTGTDVEVEDTTGTVRAWQRRRLGAIVVREERIESLTPELVARVHAAALGRRGSAALTWTAPARRLRARIAFLAGRHPGWPDVSDAAIVDELVRSLGTGPGDVPRRLGDLDLASWLLARLDHGQRRELERRAPTHFTAPTGTRVPIDYDDPAGPSIGVRVQELFGLDATPTVDSGAVALSVQLLSPAGRPVQVTRDLPGFWRGSYAVVRRELRGRYPKHPWPEDPLRATPTRRVRPAGEPPPR